jgi:hypothetical protein
MIRRRSASLPCGAGEGLLRLDSETDQVLNGVDQEPARVPEGRDGGTEPAEPAARRIPPGCALKPDLAVSRSGGHRNAAVAERRFTLGAFDERHNAGVVCCSHSKSPEHRYDAFRIIAA